MAADLSNLEAVTWSVDDLLRRARAGEIWVPDFQRSFRWSGQDVRLLFDSMYRGIPIGALLLWETDSPGRVTTRLGDLEFDKASGRGFVVIDGQQRAASLVGTLGHVASDPRFRVGFDLKERKFVSWSAEPRAHVLPLHETADTLRFLQWLQRVQPPREEVDSANQLVKSLRDYRIPIYVMRTRRAHDVREVFERINNSGRSLKAEEIFNALREGEDSLASITTRLARLGFGWIGPDWCLKVVAALLGIDVSRRLSDALKQKEASVQKAMSDAEVALTRVVEFLRGDADIPHVDLLPYRLPLVPLSKLFHLAPDPDPVARNHLSRWLWRGAWSGSHARTDAPTLRSLLASVSEDARQTSSLLLERTPIPLEPFRVRAHDFRSAGTKVVCAVLAAAKPLDLETGVEIDIPGLLTAEGAHSLSPIFQKRPGKAGTENRVLHKDVGDIRTRLVEAPDSVRRTHFVDDVAWELLTRDEEAFLERRKTLVERAVLDFLAVRAGS